MSFDRDNYNISGTYDFLKFCTETTITTSTNDITSESVRDSTDSQPTMTPFMHDNLTVDALNITSTTTSALPLTTSSNDNEYDYEYEEYEYIYWLDVTKKSQCDQAFDNFKQANLDMSRYDHIQNLLGAPVLETYLELTSRFANSSVDLESIDSHRRCKELVTIIADVTSIFQQCYELARTLPKSSSLTEALRHAEKLMVISYLLI